MAHFAEIDDNNIVVRVLVVSDAEEHRGAEFLANDCNLGGRWIQTSYNGRIRKRFAGIGMIYDENKDAFINEKPHDSWIFDDDACAWVAPTPYPADGKVYVWDENSISWQEIQVISSENLKLPDVAEIDASDLSN
jgi:hypothetical protein